MEGARFNGASIEWRLRTWDDLSDIGVNLGLGAAFGGLQSLLFLPLDSTLLLELAFLLLG